MFEEIRPLRGYAKYKQAKDSIYEYILRSGAQAGDKICTEARLIKELGISVTTVRRALDELVREEILVRKVGKGTFLKSRKVDARSDRRSILLLGHNSWPFLREDIYYGPIIRAMGQTIQRAGLRQTVLINDWGHDPASELEDIRRHAPSVIVCPYDRLSWRPFMLALAGLNIPLLIYNHPLDGLAAGQIHFDDYQGGVEAATHLMGRGYRRLATITLPVSYLTGRKRADGFVSAVKSRADCRLIGRIAASGVGEVHGYQCVDGLMARGDRPRAIFCGGDLLAYGVLKRLEELGLSVPEDVAVMGFGDFRMSPLHQSRLTTVRMDLERMGTEIGRWAIEAFGKGEADRGGSSVLKLPVETIVRETT